VHRDRQAPLVALAEVVAFQDPRHRIARRQLDHPARTERIAPLGVVADLRLRCIQHQRSLPEIRLGVRLDLLTGQRWPGRIAPGRIADRSREVADQENDTMAEVLQLPHLVEHDRMAEMQVGRCGIEPQLDAQRLTGRFKPLKLADEVLFDQ
jgi:hypothetical protein